MTARILIVLFGMLLLGCSNSVSYQQGQDMADRTYGSMSMEQMNAEVKSIMRTVKSELEAAVDKRDWWEGFCDRGEEIWLERAEQVNSAMGVTMYRTGTIKSVFNQMRSSFRE